MALLGSGVLFGLVLAEAGVRTLAAIQPGVRSYLRDPLAVLVEPHGDLGYRQKPGSKFAYSTGESATANAAGYRGPVVSRSKPPHTFRVVLLGGSATHGWGVADSNTIDRYMRDIFSSRYPNVRVEVVNLAFDGYDSYQLYERLRSDGLPLSPDVVVVNTGVNDVRNARYPDLRDRDPRTFLWQKVLEQIRDYQQRGRPDTWMLVKHYSYLARLPASVRRQREQSASRPPSLDPNPEAIDYFERNLRRIADLVDPYGIPLVLSTPPSSLGLLYAPSDTSPRGYWIRNAATTQSYRDSLSARMDQVGRSLRNAGQVVEHVAASLDGEDFLDDVHLTPKGNRTLAEVFVDAIAPYIGRWIETGAKAGAQSMVAR